MNRRILVTGSSSLVGSHFVESFGSKYDISAIGRNNFFEGTDVLESFSKVDLLDSQSLYKNIFSSDAEIIINFAAETNVDGCEKEKGRTDGRAYLVNTAAASTIAKGCKDSEKTLYQISTDFVFDGSAGPYKEEDRTGQVNRELSWYGFTKYAAEREISTQLSKYSIIRTSYPYRSKFNGKIDFARNILQLYESGRLYPLYYDQLFSPTLIDDISAAIDFLIQRNSTGIYHVACRFPTTPYEFAAYLLSKFFPLRIPIQALQKASAEDSLKLSTRAPRPVKGGLVTDKMSAAGFRLRTFEEGIQLMHEQLEKDSTTEE
jgi:dTDP-4-dehydrorhamnose reductase